MRHSVPLLLAWLLCFPPGSPAAVFQDALERSVTLPETPRRIVSLVPSVTEILFALGAKDQLAAVTDACTYPAAAQELPSIGNYADPSLEQILLYRPDLVIAAADMNSPALVRKLERLGIPVYVVYPRTLAQTLESIRQLGRVTHHEAAARSLTGALQTRLQRIRARIPAQPRPTVLVCVMLEPLTVAGPGTLIDELLNLAGGRNPVGKGPSRYPTWNSEALLTADPEVIIVSAHPGQPAPEEYFRHWPQLQAVRHERILTIDADWLHRPGPRLIRGVEALARALHPELRISE